MGVTRSKKGDEDAIYCSRADRNRKNYCIATKNSDKQHNQHVGRFIQERRRKQKPTKTHDPERPKAPGRCPMRSQSIPPKPNEPEHAPCDMARGRNDMAGAREVEGASAMAVLVRIPPRKRQSEEASGWALGLFGLVTPRAATSAAPT